MEWRGLRLEALVRIHTDAEHAYLRPVTDMKEIGAIFFSQVARSEFVTRSENNSDYARRFSAEQVRLQQRVSL